MRSLIAVLLMLAIALPAFARDRSQVREFRKANPCPATGKAKGACPGYVVDHIKPLCAGGRDHPSNMMWQDKASSYKKDAWEREVCRNMKGCAA